MPSPCAQLKQEYERLKTLNREFALAYAEVRESGDLAKVKELKKALEQARDALKEKLFVSPERARTIMGENFFGREEIKNAFGFEVQKADIPPIPYRREELEKAKALGEQLILRVSRDGGGNPLTMKRINEIVQLMFDEHDKRESDETKKKGKLLFNTDWYKNEPFYTGLNQDGAPAEEYILKTEWKLVGGSFVSDLASEKNEEGKYSKDSRNNNYIHQTRLLRDYLKSVGSLAKAEEQECSDQALRQLSEQMGVDWATQKKTDEEKYAANWQKVARQLAELRVNLNHRRSPAEILYDWALQFSAKGGSASGGKKSKDRGFLKDNYDWSRARSSDGRLVYVGSVRSGGASVGRWFPDYRDGGIGVGSLR